MDKQKKALKRLTDLIGNAEGCPVGQGRCACPSSDDCVIAEVYEALEDAAKWKPTILSVLTKKQREQVYTKLELARRNAPA